MIATRAPLRLSLGGGGTDLLSYSSRFGGFILSAAITRYVYLSANRASFDGHIRVKTRENEDVESLSELKNEIVRPALEYVGIDRDIEIVFFGDLTGGAGLGSSSANLVNLMNVLTYYKRSPLGPQALAEAAAHVEINILGRPIGKQDHYLAAFGGVRILRIDRDGSVKVEDPEIPQDTLDDLRNNLLLFYTHKKRMSGIILGEQKRLMEAGDEATLGYYHKVKDIGFAVHEALRSGDLVGFGELMHKQWMEKRRLAGGVSNPEFDRIYEVAREHGAIGGKLVGAGGGGCFLFLVEPSKKRMLKSILTNQEDLSEHPFEFDFHGAELVTAFAQRHESFPLRKIHSER